MRSISSFAFTIFLSFLSSDVAEAGLIFRRGRGLFPNIGRVRGGGCRSGMCAPRRGGCGGGMCGPSQGGGCGGGMCGPSQGGGGGHSAGGQTSHGLPNNPQSTSPGGRPIAEDEAVPAPSLEEQAAAQGAEKQTGEKLFVASCTKCHAQEKDGVIAAAKDWKKSEWESAIEAVKDGRMPKGPKKLSPEEKANLIAYFKEQIGKETESLEDNESPPAPVPETQSPQTETKPTRVSGTQAAADRVIEKMFQDLKSRAIENLVKKWPLPKEETPSFDYVPATMGAPSWDLFGNRRKP